MTPDKARKKTPAAAPDAESLPHLSANPPGAPPLPTPIAPQPPPLVPGAGKPVRGINPLAAGLAKRAAPRPIAGPGSPAPPHAAAPASPPVPPPHAPAVVPSPSAPPATRFEPKPEPKPAPEPEPRPVLAAPAEVAAPETYTPEPPQAVRDPEPERPTPPAPPPPEPEPMPEPPASVATPKEDNKRKRKEGNEAPAADAPPAEERRGLRLRRKVKADPEAAPRPEPQPVGEPKPEKVGRDAPTRKAVEGDALPTDKAALSSGRKEVSSATAGIVISEAVARKATSPTTRLPEFPPPAAERPPELLREEKRREAIRAHEQARRDALREKTKDADDLRRLEAEWTAEDALEYRTDPNDVELEVYPVNAPYGYVQIIRNSRSHETIYHVIEPKLTHDEKLLLKFVEQTMVDVLDLQPGELEKEELASYIRKKFAQVVEDYSIRLGDEESTEEESTDRMLYYVLRD
ncbi:MAG: archaeal flagellar protein FlaI, partial [Thermoplasmata archaeon]|nr:archaeal flagellar protein FlaI [Thermoplasmata archaeon]